jgi:glycosyltransferase involved in cell wall biosynthesis
MRIVITDPGGYTPPYDHGLAAGLARRGHRVELLTCPSRFGPFLEPAGFRRHELFFPLTSRAFRRAPRSRLRLPAKAAEYLPSVVRLLRCIDSLHPDVVHVQWTVLPRLDARWLLGVASRHPTVLTAHDVLPRRGRDLAAWGRIVRQVDRVVVHSAGAVAELVALGVLRTRVVLIRHPVFEPTSAETAPTTPERSTLLFFGLLRPYKGLDTLLTALALAAERVPEVRLVVAGDPIEPVDSLRRLADRLGVAQRIDWRLGFLPEAEVAELMRSATVVVLPYREISASGVLATALGHHRPVVVSDVGSMGELVREFGAGAVVAPGEPGELASACAALLEDAGALERAARGARAAASALTWDEAARAHERLYADVLAERAAARP